MDSTRRLMAGSLSEWDVSRWNAEGMVGGLGEGSTLDCRVGKKKGVGLRCVLFAADGEQ